MDRYGIDLRRAWNWTELETHASRVGARETLDELRRLLPLEEAQFLLAQLARLDDPAQIRDLSRYQRWQHNRGGSFYGVLPEQLADGPLPEPVDLPALLEAALELARVKARNGEALRNANPDYPLEFTGHSFPVFEAKTVPPEWSLALELSGIRAVLGLFRRDRVIREEAEAVASLAPFQEMITHRRDLGYLPESRLDRDGLANFLMRAVSREPLDMIWKWLNTQNLFNLADVFLYRADYERLVGELETHKDELEQQILGTIARYATDEMRNAPFRDRVSFAVGWGIAGWATACTAGINLEHFKDDYERLLTTLVHETFHQFQLRICPRDPSTADGARSFEDLARFPFPDERDGKFYEALSTTTSLPLYKQICDVSISGSPDR